MGWGGVEWDGGRICEDKELKAGAPFPSSAKTPLSVLMAKKFSKRNKLCMDAVQNPEKTQC